MSITCEDLLRLRNFQKIKLRAGHEGLGAMVTWPYVGQTASVANWVHGGELLFITGVSHAAADLRNILRECVQKKLAGLVVLVGNEYIQKIPEDLIQEAEEAAFPLFEMPWDVKLIDVTREITDKIVEEQFTRKLADNFLSKLLFSTEVDYDALAEQAVINGINVQEKVVMAVFNLQRNASGGGVENIADNSLEEKLQQTLQRLCRDKGLNPLTFVYGNHVLCLLSATSVEACRQQERYLRVVHSLLRQIFTEADCYLGIGRVYTGLRYVRYSYEEAKKALELCKKMRQAEQVAHYEELGVYRLLLKIEDREEIRQFYHYNLDPLLSYDAKNNTALTDTLRAFLLANGNLAKTAQNLFIHRNTLVYRINQIQELLDKDIESAVVRLDLFNSLLAKEYLGE